MDVDCEGCAGCCIDWRAIAPADVDLESEPRGERQPLDDAYNLVPLTSDEVRGFLEAGLGDAMTPRLFAGAGRRESGDPGERVATVDGHDLAAFDGRPAFHVGLRTAPKPVAPFGADPAWLPTCVFLDPGTLQCRIHGGDRYPDACATYPGDNLVLDVESECERVEAAFGGERLLADDPGDADPLSGRGALGARVFAHPEPGRLAGSVERIAAGDPTDEDRAEFVAVAAASRPGTLAVDAARYERARERALAADSWVGAAVDEWARRAVAEPPEPRQGEAVEDRRGAPATPGWD